MPMNTFIMLEAEAAKVDWLSEGLTALISGMGGVFIILILISLIISSFKYIKSGTVETKHEDSRINAKVEIKHHVIIKEEEKEEEDDLELIAVITAAIAASLNTTTDQLLVKSFRRISRKNQYSR